MCSSACRHTPVCLLTRRAASPRSYRGLRPAIAPNSAAVAVKEMAMIAVSCNETIVLIVGIDQSPQFVQHLSAQKMQKSDIMKDTNGNKMNRKELKKLSVRR